MARIIQTADLTPTTRLNDADAEWIYNGLDVCVTLEVLHKISEQLDNISSATYAFSRSLQAPVLDMAMRGLLVNRERRDQVLRDYNECFYVLEDHLTRIVRVGIGLHVQSTEKSRWWRSPHQLKML